jgi:hypothetical protein
MNKQPDLDFCVTKDIATLKVSVDSCLELTSDHTPIIVSIHTRFQQQPKRPSLHNKNTDWEVFRTLLETQISLKIPLKTEAEVEDAVYNLTTQYNKQPGEPHRPSGNSTFTMTARSL